MEGLGHCPVPRRLLSAAANHLSLSGATLPTSDCATRSITGHVSPPSAIPSVESDILRCANVATRTDVLSVVSRIDCLPWHVSLWLLVLDLAAPDHSTMSRRGETLPVSQSRLGSEPVHLLVDSTGLELCGPGEWLVEKRAARTRRSWRKLHIGVDADTGQIIAAELTDNDVDDGSRVGPLFEQIAGTVASFTGDGAYDRDDVYREVGQHHQDAAVIVPPPSSAGPSATAQTVPTKRDRHLQLIAERVRMGWQRASGYNWRALVEADIGRYKRVIADALRSRTEGRQTTEVAIAVASLNRMLELGRPECVRLT